MKEAGVPVETIADLLARAEWWHDHHGPGGPRRGTLIGVEQYAADGEFPVERGYIWTWCASVENGNPLYWDDEVAQELTGGPIAPPTMVSVWFRPHHWAPGRTEEALALQVHFDLKAMLGLPEAVMTDNTIKFHTPVRVGDGSAPTRCCGPSARRRPPSWARAGSG